MGNSCETELTNKELFTICKESYSSPFLKFTSYEIYTRRKSNIPHLDVFGLKWFVIDNEKDTFDKFVAKTNEGLFLDYSTYRKAFSNL